MKNPENDELFHVEHSEYSSFKPLRLFILAVLIFIPACKSEDPEPEKKDPIYNDLSKEHATATAAAEKEIKKIEDYTKEYQKTEVRTIDRKSVARDRALAQESLRKYEQKIEYYRIAKIQRQYKARTSYKQAFVDGSVWPDPKEVQNYLQDKKMLAVSRNWNVRVPKPSSPLNSVKLSGDSKDTDGETAEGKDE